MLLQSLLDLVPFYLLYSSLVGFPGATAQANQNPVLDDQTDAFINNILSEWKSPGGVGIAFVRKNDQGEWINVETKGYGRANARGDRVTENTTFNIGSNSKVSASKLDNSNFVSRPDILPSYSPLSLPVYSLTTKRSPRAYPGTLGFLTSYPSSTSQIQ